MKIFIDNKQSFTEIIPYGFLDLIKNYVGLLSHENFIENPNLHIPLEAAANNEAAFSSSFRGINKLSMVLIEKISQKLSLISLILHALDGLLDYQQEGNNLNNNNNIYISSESENRIKDDNAVDSEKILKLEKIPSNSNPPLIEPYNKIQLIYAINKEKKGFSDYLNLSNSPNTSNTYPIYLCFDSLYDILESVMKMITPVSSKETIACYCNIAEVIRNISKILTVMKDIEFEHITKVLNCISNACIFRSLEIYIDDFPIFDYIIETCYLIYERFKFSVEKHIGAIYESLIKEKGFFNTISMKKHIYIYFLNTISKLNFKKIGWDLKNTLYDLTDILVAGMKNYKESIYIYYLLIIIKQIVLHYDIKTYPVIFENLNEILSFLLNFLQYFKKSIEATENTADKARNTDENMSRNKHEIEAIEKHVLVFCYENLLLCIYFQEFHNLLISSQLFPITLYIGTYMLNLYNNFSNIDNKSYTYIHALNYQEEEILNILKLLAMLLNHSTYYMVFHEHLSTEEMLSFLLEFLMSNIKQLQLISFNSIINLIEANGIVLIKRVLEISIYKIDEINKLLILKKNEKKVNLEPFLSILEHIYFSKEIFLASENEEENREIKHFIAMLVTNVIIEKHDLKLSKKILDIVFKEAYLSIEIEARLLMILLKIIYFSEGLIIDLRDTVLEFFRNSLKIKQEMLRKSLHFAGNLALISIPTIKKFVNTDIRSFKDPNVISLENTYFWEYCADQHT